jgi:hypothetical protein
MVKAERLPFVVTKHYDFTPARLAFGSMQDELMPWARYFKHNGRKWVVVPFEEMHAKYKGHLRYGTLELFAQCNTLSFPWGHSGILNRQIILPPLIGQRANASCTFRAIEDSCPELSVASLLVLARLLPWIIYVDGPDNASANALKKTCW